MVGVYQQKSREQQLQLVHLVVLTKTKSGPFLKEIKIDLNFRKIRAQIFGNFEHIFCIFLNKVSHA